MFGAVLVSLLGRELRLLELEELTPENLWQKKKVLSHGGCFENEVHAVKFGGATTSISS